MFVEDFFQAFISVLLKFSVVFCVLVVVFYLYFQYSYTYWKRNGVPYLQPKFPLGNNTGIGPLALSYGIESFQWYNELKKQGHKLGGVWSWAKPVLVITDPDYIKDVLLKDFSYFVDRDFYSNPKYDPKNHNLFTLSEERWKTVRMKLTPTFTTAKMKMMLESIKKCAEPLVECFEKGSTTGENLDLQDLTASFTTDVVGVIAFGIEPESFKNSKFRQMGRDIFDVSFLQGMRNILTRLCRPLAMELGIKNIPPHVTEYFTEIIKNNIEYRRKNNIQGSDFPQLLMNIQDATKNDPKPFSFDELVANTIVFYLAGFDTSSITMNNALYELAQNPKLQDRTRQEINEVIAKYNGELTYEGLQEITYLRQVVDEALRLYPPVATLSRVAVKPYTLKDTNVTIEKGTTVLVSALGLGRDPEFFPDPYKFDPDRFSPENKANIRPFSYVPFGDGPRNCIAAFLVVKAGPLQAGCTVTSYGQLDHAVKTCNNLVIDGITVPAKKQLKLELKNGTTVTFKNTIKFEFAKWDGPLVLVTGNKVTVNGKGATLNGQGEKYWDGKGENGMQKPKFFKIKTKGGSKLNDIKLVNCPVHCVSIYEASDTTLDGWDINVDNGKPDSKAHNTDGFDVSESKGITIKNSAVRNQDDCVCVNQGSNYVFHNLHCGGGHGLSLSVGLSKLNGAKNTLRNVTFSDCTVENSRNAIHVKTHSDGGTGIISDVTYKSIHVSGISHCGISVEQNYKKGKASGDPKNNIKIHNLILDTIGGSMTSSSETTAVYVLCAKGGCDAWNWNQVTLNKGKRANSCTNYTPKGFNCL